MIPPEPSKNDTDEQLRRELRKLVRALLDEDPDVMVRAVHALRHLAVPGVVSLVTLELLHIRKAGSPARRRRADLALALVLPLGMLPGPDVPTALPSVITSVPT